MNTQTTRQAHNAELNKERFRRTLNPTKQQAFDDREEARQEFWDWYYQPKSKPVVKAERRRYGVQVTEHHVA